MTDGQEIFEKIPVDFRVPVALLYPVQCCWILGQANRRDVLLLPPSAVLVTISVALSATSAECDRWHPGPAPAVVITPCLPKFLL